jgi:lipopolysaccharide biosynthesis glycosyltransferase
VAPGLFDQVHTIVHVHARAKLECMLRSRFKRTLYLDCDTLVVGDPCDGFDLLERFEVAMAHDVRRASALIRAGLEVETPYAFPQLNSGVVYYRRSPAVSEFLATWARRFHESGQPRDQVVLKDLLWRSDLRIYVLPPEYNLRRVTILDAWEPLDARVKIIHSHRLMDHMRSPGAPRITTVEELVRAEKAALEEEWKALGVSGEERAIWLIEGPGG